MVTEGYNICIQIVTYLYPHQNLFGAYILLVILLQSQGTFYFCAYFCRSTVREVWCRELFPDTNGEWDKYVSSICCLNAAYNPTNGDNTNHGGASALQINIDYGINRFPSETTDSFRDYQTRSKSSGGNSSQVPSSEAENPLTAALIDYAIGVNTGGTNRNEVEHSKSHHKADTYTDKSGNNNDTIDADASNRPHSFRLGGSGSFNQ